MKKRLISMMLAVVMILSAVAILPLAAVAEEDYADTVVYGRIYTAEAEKPTAEAIAVKDGKYIYVGDEAGAAARTAGGCGSLSGSSRSATGRPFTSSCSKRKRQNNLRITKPAALGWPVFNATKKRGNCQKIS